MSASNEWTDWHLTKSQGWVSGSSKTDNVGVKEIPPPADRVQTVREREYMGSSFSSVQTSYDVVWESPDKEEVARLLAIHGSHEDNARRAWDEAARSIAMRGF